MRRLLVVGLAIALLFPSAASGWSVLSFAHGLRGAIDGCACGVWLRTAGFTSRQFVRVYHEEGKWWSVLYEDTNGNDFGWVTDTANPTVQSNNASYAKAFALNHDDGGPVEFTAQTTQP